MTDAQLKTAARQLAATIGGESAGIVRMLVERWERDSEIVDKLTLTDFLKAAEAVKENP